MTKSQLLATTSLTNPGAAQQLLEGLILQSRDVIRWLYYRENGFDAGPIPPDSQWRQELNQHFLTHIWGQGGDLTEKLAKMTDDQRMETKQRLTKILMWAKPFLDYMRANGLSAQR